ncbi:GNAT family N-acetyltransferase [Roseobacter sp.]|uniref:GNAT family N-acetyltransferase n=1 Tax=Roseobacter sp. TaxID=1907202 RepID=UPI00296767A4|nr:GNAT family N-acetyltransferase [Roseobacter sp.]MDW3182694.1 GNAT family N-acetyltransferase [Roseobacter sp.]
MGFDIARAQVSEEDVAALLDRHFELMRAQSPEESCHVLPAEDLAAADVSLFALRDQGQLLAIGAIRNFGDWGELKSMHTAQEARGRGAGKAMLTALMQEARALGLKYLNLETGSGAEHLAARRLYETAGFSECPPFGDYVADPLSVFMTRTLRVPEQQGI